MSIDCNKHNLKSNNKETYNLATSLIKKGGEHFEYFIQNVSLTNLLTIITFDLIFIII